MDVFLLLELPLDTKERQIKQVHTSQHFYNKSQNLWSKKNPRLDFSLLFDPFSSLTGTMSRFNNALTLRGAQ